MSRSTAREVVRAPKALFEALYRDHFGLVWALVRRSSISVAHHEDVVQDVWLTVHRRLHSYDPAASAAGWIAAITRFVLWRHVRGTARAKRKLSALSATAPDPVEAIEDRETLRWVDDALARLDPIHREALLLVEIDGLTGPELAARLGVPLNTAYSRVRVARERMQRMLEALEEPRAHATAPKRVVDRTWAVLVPVLEGGASAAVAATKTSWIVTAIVVALSGAGIFAAARATAPRVETRANATPSAQSEPTSSSPARVHPKARAVEPVTTSDIAPIETPTPIASPPVATPTRSPSPSRESSPSARPDVRDESTLLTAAMAALQRGEGKEALRLLHAHEQRFPGGALAIERRAARVRALCLVGKIAQARGEAAILVRDHPHAPAAVAVRDACSEQ